MPRATGVEISAEDAISITEAQAKLTELAEEVVRTGGEKVLTKNRARYVALIDARRLDYYHALEAEYANLVLLDEAKRGLDDIAQGRVVSANKLRTGLRK